MSSIEEKFNRRQNFRAVVQPIDDEFEWRQADSLDYYCSRLENDQRVL